MTNKKQNTADYDIMDFKIENNILIRYLGDSEEVHIPPIIKEIKRNAFSGNETVKSVLIPKSVKKLQYRAFEKCSNLKTVIFEESSKPANIGCAAFEKCTALTDIVIPDRVKVIENSAFAYCTSLKSIMIGKGVKSIEPHAFSGCIGLESITIAKENPVYHSAGNCIIDTRKNALIAGCKASVIPADGSVTSIEKFAFFDCNTLTNIAIPDCVTGIGKMAFSYDNNSIDLISISLVGISTSSPFLAYSYSFLPFILIAEYIGGV